LLNEGVYTSVSEIGDAEAIGKSYVSRILRLTLLAPDLVDTILAGRSDGVPMLERLEGPLATSLDEQQRRLFFLMTTLIAGRSALNGFPFRR
jgi:hypothetical protein